MTCATLHNMSAKNYAQRNLSVWLCFPGNTLTLCSQGRTGSRFVCCVWGCLPGNRFLCVRGNTGHLACKPARPIGRVVQGIVFCAPMESLDTSPDCSRSMRRQWVWSSQSEKVFGCHSKFVGFAQSSHWRLWPLGWLPRSLVFARCGTLCVMK